MVAAGRVQQRVSEFGIQCDETALLADAALDHIAVQRPLHLLIGDGEDIESGLEQHRGRRATEILVELELHTGPTTGMST